MKKIDYLPALFLTLTPLGSIILIPLLIFTQGWHWSYLFSFVLFWAVTSFCITGGYHRYLAHRSYDTTKWVKFFYLLFGAASFQGSALKWCSDHRQHHRYVDTNKDPYNIRQGFWFAHIGWLFHEQEPEKKSIMAPDLMKDDLIMWQHRYYAPIAIVMGFGIPTLLGWVLGSAFGGLVFGAFLRIVVTHHCTFFINSFCHKIGRQPYSDTHSARDSFLMALFTYGEGYHNFHHEFQADYRNGVRWYQWDPTKWSIALLALFGSAHKLKRVAPEVILSARLIQDEKLVRGRPVCQERLLALKLKVEHAQGQLKSIHREYIELKKRVHEHSKERVLHLKTEMKIAKLEFKAAYAQWKAYIKFSHSIA